MHCDWCSYSMLCVQGEFVVAEPVEKQQAACT
jgi:hypothetical protein